jgi:hypothetical protein
MQLQLNAFVLNYIVILKRKFWKWCYLKYAESNQQNALNSILFTFSFYDDSYMFRQNNAILRKQLCSFPRHFNVNTVRDKS